MSDPLMLLASGIVMMLWRPCRSREARAPRLAIAMLLLTVASVWVGILGLAIGFAAGELGDPVRACGVLWRQLLAGDIAWPRVLPLMLWVLLFVGRAVVAGIARREDQAALTRSARCGRRTRFGDSNVTLVPDLGTPAVTVGVLRASVIVDALFWAEAAESERRVVVAHEVAHLRGRHGLVEWMSRALIAPLLPLPVAGDIYDCVRRHLEALADDAAVRQHGRRAVGEALSAIALARTPVGGLGAAGDCVWRVRRLVAPARKRSWKDLAIFVPLVAMMAIGVMGATADAAAALGPVAQADVCAI